MPTQEVNRVDLASLTHTASHYMRDVDDAERELNKALKDLIHQRVQLRRSGYTLHYGYVFQCRDVGLGSKGEWRTLRRGDLHDVEKYSYEDECFPSFEAIVTGAWVEHQPQSTVAAYISFLVPGRKVEFYCEATKVDIDLIADNDSA